MCILCWYFCSVFLKLSLKMHKKLPISLSAIINGKLICSIYCYCSQLLEQEKMKRIHELHDQCLKINESVLVLRTQEALRQSRSGTRDVQPMCRRQIKEEIRKVQNGMNKLHDWDRDWGGPSYPSLTEGIKW